MRNINRLISGYNFNPGSVSRIKYIVIHYVGGLRGRRQTANILQAAIEMRPHIIL